MSETDLSNREFLSTMRGSLSTMCGLIISIRETTKTIIITGFVDVKKAQFSELFLCEFKLPFP